MLRREEQSLPRVARLSALAREVRWKALYSGRKNRVFDRQSLDAGLGVRPQGNAFLQVHAHRRLASTLRVVTNSSTRTCPFLLLRICAVQAAGPCVLNVRARYIRAIRV